jgi:hypothetical protein
VGIIAFHGVQSPFQLSKADEEREKNFPQRLPKNGGHFKLLAGKVHGSQLNNVLHKKHGN